MNLRPARIYLPVVLLTVMFVAAFSLYGPASVRSYVPGHPPFMQNVTVSTPGQSCLYRPLLTLNISAQVRSNPKFVALDGGRNFSLVSSHIDGPSIAYVDGTSLATATTTMSNGTATLYGSVSYATTITYPPHLYLDYMKFEGYTYGDLCPAVRWTEALGWIRASIPENPDGTFDLSMAGFNYYAGFRPNGTVSYFSTVTSTTTYSPSSTSVATMGVSNQTA